ncbi:MAG: ABC transporter permease [Candidatus Sumerlaeaceae bacterium]|nr:ABC transporter permease [Candidatus Sumerlaeaceae bacterium]
MSAPIEREVARNRHLMAAFVSREMRTRYAGSTFGAFWSVIHPLIMLFLYIMVFSTLMPRGASVSVRDHVATYAIFLCPAILAWNWFNESLAGACGSVTNNASLIRKVAFPASILPLTGILSAAIPFLVAMVLFMVFVVFRGAFGFGTLIWLPFVCMMQLGLMVGLAYALAALNVAIRDTSQFLVAGLQFLFWGTPIVYQQEQITRVFPAARWWFEINPVAHLMGAYRDAIIAHRHPQLESVLYVGLVSIIFYHAGRTLFMRGRRVFADEV